MKEKGYKTISISEIEAKRRGERVYVLESKFACILWGYSYIESLSLVLLNDSFLFSGEGVKWLLGNAH